MASQQDIDQQRRRLATYRATLATLRTQQATFTSAYAPPQLVVGSA
jgi:hypothetical protein